MDCDRKKTNPNPWSKAGFVSRLFFWWLIPLLCKGWKGNLKESDIYDCPKEESSENIGRMLQNEWNEELKKFKDGHDPSLLRATLRAFGLQYAIAGFFMVIQLCFINVAQPIMMGYLIRHFARISQLTILNLYLCASGMCALVAVLVFTHHHYYFGVYRAGLHFRIACSRLLYKKALKMTHAALGKTTVGQMVNLLSNDISKCEQSFRYVPYLVAGPIQALIIVGVLWMYIGYAAIAGVSTFILYLPFQLLMRKPFSKLRAKTAGLTDERIHLMNEIIGGIRVIKMYAWEKPFTHLVEQIRRKEIRKIQHAVFLQGSMTAVSNITSKFMLLITFVVFVLGMQGDLTPDKVFICMYLFHSLQGLLTTFIIRAITQSAEGDTSLKRIQKFLLLEEQSESFLESQLRHNTDQCGIWMKNVTTSFKEDGEATVRNLTLSVKPGELLMIIGPVGSGKTSLLMSILGELLITSGDIKVKGKVAYSSQEHWSFGGSVRDNIIFGSDFNEEKYKKVLNVCSLEKDIERFPYGDQTAVGERGVFLSGGQKARINLARAMYFDADIYLLDDPLSAVDPSVSKDLFNRCINGYLKDKVRILVTHQIQFLKEASKILVLKDGGCLAQGTYEEINESEIDLQSFIGNYGQEQNHQPDPTTVTTITISTDDVSKQVSHNATSSRLYKSTKSISSSAHGYEEFKDKPKEKTLNANEETKSTGSININVYKDYLKTGAGFFLICFILFSYVGNQVIASGSDFWLTVWTNLEQLKVNNRDCWSQVNKTFLKATGFYTRTLNSSSFLGILHHDNSMCLRITQNYTIDYYDIENKEDIQFHLLIYTGFVLGMLLISLLHMTSFFAMCMKASIKLHNKMFLSVLRSPAAFFDNNPVGRVLNRFSKDTGVLDEGLPMLAFDTLRNFSKLMGIICVVAIVEPYLILPTGVLAAISFFVRKFYMFSAQEIKRYENIARSPIYSHLSISIHGLTTIRAFKMQPSFESRFDYYQDQHTAPNFAFVGSIRWLGVILEWIYFIYVTLVTFTMIIISEDPSFASRAGLAIASAIQLCGGIQWVFQLWADTESQMTSVERVIEYSHLKPEAFLESSRKSSPPKNWPTKGHIVYEDVSLRYAANESPVLKHLKFEVYPEEKIGIVGRTGAGKSSIIAALFRMTEPEGLIKVDGLATNDIGLHDLRKKISIIPQDPVLFTGPIRKNLDPFGEHSDIELWQVLEEAYLKELIEEMPGGLDTAVSEGGSNFSVGQRQLICLARAVLRKNRILVLDEATANIDTNTDSLIQQTIRDRFAHCTVLTIAHRLHTIMDSDRVLVLDAGEIKEFDTPYSLLQNPDSFFSLMVQKTGPSMMKQLKDVAFLAHLKRISDNKESVGTAYLEELSESDIIEIEAKSTPVSGKDSFADGHINESYEHSEEQTNL